MDLMTIAQAAEVLGISRSLVRRYCREGRLSAVQYGRDWLIERRVLTTFAQHPRHRGRPRLIRTAVARSK